MVACQNPHGETSFPWVSENLGGISPPKHDESAKPKDNLKNRLTDMESTARVIHLDLGSHCTRCDSNS